MRYLIDGYNLFFQLQETILPLEEKREEFIALVDSELGNSQLRAMMVFDSHQENSSDFASQKRYQHLEVVFSPKGLSADHYLLELLEWDAKNTTLVTSDQSLAKRAKHLGAKTLTVKGFVSYILNRARKKQKNEKPLYRESKEMMNRYLEAFEKNDES